MPTRTRLKSFAFAGVALAAFAFVGTGRSIALAQDAPNKLVTGDAAAKAAITKVLDDQTAAWNRGDLDTFLEGYWKSPKVVFQSGGTRFDGFDAMRDRYRKRYQSDGKAMGRVSFSDVEIEPIGPESAFVRGRYELTMPDGTRPSGLFTLIFRRFDNGWKITHDHTSTAESSAPASKSDAIPPPPLVPLPKPPR